MDEGSGAIPKKPIIVSKIMSNMPSTYIKLDAPMIAPIRPASETPMETAPLPVVVVFPVVPPVGVVAEGITPLLTPEPEGTPDPVAVGAAPETVELPVDPAVPLAAAVPEDAPLAAGPAEAVAKAPRPDKAAPAVCFVYYG